MNRKNRGAMIIGLLLIVFGVLFLLDNLGIFSINFNIFDIGFLISRFWPLFIIIPGLIFHATYFNSKTSDAGILVPGGILLTAGMTCQLSMLFGLWGVLWPGFILSVAVGLFELYVFGNRDKGLLIPVFILGSLSLIFFAMSLGRIFYIRTFLIPAVLILGGILLLSRNKRY